MADNRLQELIQSEYKPSHSIETALLHVQNDIHSALDVSGVFSHLTILRETFGVQDSSLSWFVIPRPKGE